MLVLQSQFFSSSGDFNHRKSSFQIRVERMSKTKF